MTENETKLILNVRISRFDHASDVNEALEVAKNALEEIQQYREIGTVEKVKQMSDELDRWHTNKINEKIKNPFAYTSTSICHNCDHKDEYIEELEAEIEQYKAIGTVAECREAMEKQRAKKSEGRHGYFVRCPICETFMTGIPAHRHCTYCGQGLE